MTERRKTPHEIQNSGVGVKMDAGGGALGVLSRDSLGRGGGTGFVISSVFPGLMITSFSSGGDESATSLLLPAARSEVCVLLAILWWHWGELL